MKKTVKTLLLLPLWPLIWLQLGFSLNTEPQYGSGCALCGDWGCHERAIKLVKWWRA